MNKNHYRIIFNKARGQVMAVAETATSQGKASSETSAPSKSKRRSLTAAIKPLAFFVWGLFGMAMIPVTHAQIVADPTAAANQRPTVSTAKNKVPLVNIQTPSAAGVSRNAYSQFDVQQQGAILNNSRSNVQTQLGGWIEGNPWLGAGSARVILNEVNSNNPSLLKGYVEIAGQRAQFVIANPSGVTCDGCGFINANRATITTGTPILDSGNLTGFLVQRGVVTIAGSGMDASTADYTDIITRAVLVNAGIWANQLKIVTGTNQISIDQTTNDPSVSGTTAGTGAAPAFAIDTAQLGGMYAGKITLLATEAGVGVRNAGKMYAGVGDAIITVNGQLQNAGEITSSGQARIDTQNGVQNTGLVYAQGDTTITTRGDINNSGPNAVIASQNNTALSATGSNSKITSTSGSVLAAGVQTNGAISSSGNLTASATQSIASQGKNLSGGDQSLTAQTVDLSGSQTSGRNFSVTASNGDINLANATLAASRTLTANTNQTLRTNGASVSANQINVTAHDLSNVRGQITQTDRGDIAINLLGNLDNTEGSISASGDATIASDSLNNTQGKITAGQALTTNTTQAINNAQGLLAANGQVTLTAGQINNQAGTIGSIQDAVSITAQTGVLNNQAGRIEAAKSASLSAAGITNIDGTITAKTNATLTSSGTINNTNGSVSAGNTLALRDTAANKTLVITNTNGTLIAGQQLTVDSDSLSGDGNVLSQGNLNIKLKQSITNSGQIIANGDATVETDATLTNQGTFEAGNTLNAKAASINNQAGGTISASNVNLQTTDLQTAGSHTITNRGTINGTETVLETQTLNNLGTGKIYGDHIAIGATTVTNAAENGTAPVIAARDRLDIGADIINNRGHAIMFSSGDVAIGGALDASKHATGQATTLNNDSATIEATGSADINAKTINNTNQNFSTKTEILSEETFHEYQGQGSPNRYNYNPPEVYVYSNQSDYLHTPEGDYETWSRYDYTRTVSETRVSSSDPAKITSGSAMRITADTVNNDKSQIVAGGTLTGTIGTLNNTEVAGERVTTDSGSVTSYRRVRPSHRHDYTGSGEASYNPAPTIQDISLTPTVYQQNTAPRGSGTQVAALSTATVNKTPGAAGQGGPNTPIMQVVAASSSASGPATVVRSGGVNTGVPGNSMFGITPDPTAHYLIETDPAFANYRTWLSSEYMLNALSLNPALTQKRLGDGFYEQKLIREQVAQLTGRRFLDGYANDETQYQALMNSGVTFAKTYNLVPGVSLSAAQMAQLTNDIVWLVEKDITLPNGKTTKALVPQLYVHVQEGDLQSGGALIAGNNVKLNIKGDLLNGGTIAGRKVVSLTAENINNLGGRVLGTDVGVAAGTDLNNIGGTIAASNSLVANAGRDLNVVSNTRTQTNAHGSQTNIERVAGLYVTGGKGMLLASAGRDTNLIAAAIQNQGSGDTSITANNNVNLGTVTQSSNNSVVWDDHNYRKDSSKVDTGTSIQTQGNLTLAAGNDLNAKAANVTSSQGNLLATAVNNVNLAAGEANIKVDEAHQHKSSGLFSSTTTTTRDTLDQTTAQATTLSGKTTTVLANKDINVKGSNVVSDNGTTLAAQNNINIVAETNTSIEEHFKEVKTSGLFSGGSFGFTVGTRQQSTDQNGVTKTAAASTIGSTQGDINLRAGKSYTQTGSDVIAPQGDINIGAQKVDINEARETNNNQIESKFRQSGLTVALTSPIISTIQTAQQMSKAARDTSDSRMKALAAANIGFSGKNTADAIKAGQGTTVDEKRNQVSTGKTGADGKTITRDAKAQDKAGGINIAISIGGSRSDSKTVQTSDSARGSNVAAGHNLNVTASGAGKDSDITVQGSTLQAGNRAALDAQDEIKLLAARNTADQHSTNKSINGSVGVSLGSDGLLFTASASGARGNADGSDVTWTNTHVNAGDQVVMTSGGDTTVKGAVVKAPQITANVGGNLNVESLQDTSKFDSKQQSIGGSVSFGYGKWGGSFSASNSNVDSDFASVVEQSGFRAGDKGFNVKVAKNTDLKGGAITSTQKAIDDNKNNFSTGGDLTTSDIQNQASYKASSFGVSAGSGGASSAGFGSDSGSASSTTMAAISGIAGNKGARTGDAESGIHKIFDADKVQKDIDAQVQITQTFSREASKAVANYAASKINDIKAQQTTEAKKADPDIGKLQELKEEQQKWEEGGIYRTALHAAAGGLAGDALGALGSGAASAAAPLLNDLQDNIAKGLENAGVNKNIAKSAAQLIAGTTAAGIGSIASGGSAAGAATAFNEDSNNRQLHPTEIQWIKDNAEEFAKKQGITKEEAIKSLTQQALKDIDYLWRAQLSDGDDKAAEDFLASNKKTFENDLKENQRLFTTKGQQLLRPEMFADRTDPDFYKQFARNGISRPLGMGLIKEIKDSGVDLKDGVIDLAKAVMYHPDRVLDALLNGVKELPGWVANTAKETGHATGEGAAVAINEDISKKLNDIYGTDVSGYQRAMLAIRTTMAVGGTAVAAKTAATVTNFVEREVASAISEKAAAKAAAKAKEEAITKERIGFNSRTDDGDQFGIFRNSDGNKWNYPPNYGAVAGTEKTVILEKGLIVDRFGDESGNFVSPAGAPFDQRSLPPGSASNPLRRYQVTKPLPDAVQSEIAPAFGKPGGGIQIYLENTIGWYVKNGYLKEVK